MNLKSIFKKKNNFYHDGGGLYVNDIISHKWEWIHESKKSTQL